MISGTIKDLQKQKKVEFLGGHCYFLFMHIVKVKTGVSKKGTSYYTHKLLETYEDEFLRKTRKRMILNLGAGYSFPPEQWKSLCSRLEEILTGTPSLFPYPPNVEEEAQRLVKDINRKLGLPPQTQGQYQSSFINVDEIESPNPKSVGVEYIALNVANKLQLPQILSSIGLTDDHVNSALALVIGRMAKPGSELATYRWLREKSGLGDLLNTNFSERSIMALYRAADKLIDNFSYIEESLYQNISLNLKTDKTIALYDLTNTYFEGSPNDDDAKRGHSKEKRVDCPLVSLAIMLDVAGFIQKSKILPGNISEPKTLEAMVNALNPPEKTMFIMDRGIATAENLAWLRERKFRYLVVNREMARDFDKNLAKPLITASGDEIFIYSVITENNTEKKLLCFSPKRRIKEKAMLSKAMGKYEEALTKLNARLKGPKAKNDALSVSHALGKLYQRFSGASQYFKVDIIDNAASQGPGEPLKVLQINFERKEKQGSKLTHPGVYSLKTNALKMPDEQMWQTYIKLTNVESVFRSLKSELGLRPIFHHIKSRIDSHLFITILAYQLINAVRIALQSKNITISWKRLVEEMETHSTITVISKNILNNVLQVKYSSNASPYQLKIYNALNLDPKPIKKTKKLIVDK
jgi:hypothetical protein